MAKTYEPIATTTLGSAQSSVTFSSISGSYTDIQIVFNGGAASALNMWIRFNGDSATNYSGTFLGGTGSAASSARQTSQAQGLCSYEGYMTNDLNSTILIDVLDYVNATTNKTWLSRSNNAGYGVNANAGLWRNTATINQITLLAGGGNFNTGSTFTLYGIKAA